MANLKNQIKKLLNNKNWTIVCKRAENFMKDQSLSIDKVIIVVTTDMNFLDRKHVTPYYKNIIGGKNIGVRSFGGNYSTMYVCQLA